VEDANAALQLQQGPARERALWIRGDAKRMLGEYRVRSGHESSTLGNGSGALLVERTAQQVIFLFMCMCAPPLWLSILLRPPHSPERAMLQHVYTIVSAAIARLDVH